MRSTVVATIVSAVSVAAHYNFEALIVNGQVTGRYEYVRQTTNSNSPVTDVTSPDFVCNKGGLDADIMAKTATQAVAPGDQVGFTVNTGIGHPGPLAVYMSRAPDGTAAAAYDGSGQWFKAYELTTSSITAEGLQWATYVGGVGINNFTFTLPADLPAGEYLMRAEHTALHGAYSAGGVQFYIGCAQLSVSGAGAGSPAPLVSIPGVYDGSESGININIYYPIPTAYQVAGPATWPGACEDHSANSADVTSDGDCNASSSEGGGRGGEVDGISPRPTTPSAPAATTPSRSRPAVSSPALSRPTPTGYDDSPSCSEPKRSRRKKARGMLR